MKKIKHKDQLFLLIFLLSFFGVSCQSQTTNIEGKKWIGKTIQVADVQYKRAIKETENTDQIPRTLHNDGSLASTGVYDWTSGFFAGDLWYIYELSQNKYWKEEAQKYTEKLSKIQHWSGSHDVGFMINCSYGNGLKFHPEYKDVIVNTAKALSKRYMPKAKCILSWNRNRSWHGYYWENGAVIIDNMMNLELLFRASDLSGDPKYKDIAIQHAETTMKNHYRDDYSSYHVLEYDRKTGEVLKRETAQGFSDNSAWARGQSWGLYGFVVCYRETHDKKFLAFAENIAHYLMNHPNMPKDHIPYWDYNAGQKGYTPAWDYNPNQFKEQPRDVSAASVMASALLELSTYAQGKGYRKYAVSILSSLQESRYMASDAEQNYFILKESVGSIPHKSEIRVPLNYADYYYLEALLREQRLENNQSVVENIYG